MSVPENGPMRREHFDVTNVELELLKGKIKNFPAKEKLKEFITITLALQEMLKGIL